MTGKPAGASAIQLLAVLAAFISIGDAFVNPSRCSGSSISWNNAFVSSSSNQHRQTVTGLLMTSSLDAAIGSPTELPDSLDDAAVIAAQACADYAEASSPKSMCRVDFDTSAGDETYTTLKSSTEFMQKFTSALCYALIPGLMEERQKEMMRVAQAQGELQQLLADQQQQQQKLEDDENDNNDEQNKLNEEELQEKIESLQMIIANNGKDPEAAANWKGPVARIYFPDEGNAALARRDWTSQVPSCVDFSSCGGIQLQDISKDRIHFFFCPRASESEFCEEVMLQAEKECADLALTIFVNPLLVDMGVTGFGMAGRLLRERLIDQLENTYYLRTLQWGALTRTWPRQFTVWQEDENASGGYRCIKTLDRWPSNPEVEDIYDIENGNKVAGEGGAGMLDALGDFVSGMMKL